MDSIGDKAMYEDATTKVRVNGRVRLLMLGWRCIRAVLSPLLFIIGLEALSREFG